MEEDKDKNKIDNNNKDDENNTSSMTNTFKTIRDNEFILWCFTSNSE